MAVLHDDEFGPITIRRSARASSIKISVAPNGHLRASMPTLAPVFLLNRLIAAQRPTLRQLYAQHKTLVFHDGMQIGKSHTLLVRPVSAAQPSVIRSGQQIIVSLPSNYQLNDDAVTRQLRKQVIDALRTEAKHYLPRKLAHMANKYGYYYERVRFSHASGRWGSCSSSGTISLNIALMKLPFELIDYVLAHELSHTRHMNHSPEFWQCVGTVDHLYKQHRTELKKHSPSI